MCRFSLGTTPKKGVFKEKTGTVDNYNKQKTNGAPCRRAARDVAVA